MAKEYFPGIDVLKGGLILLVILGHLLPGSLNENFARFFIYSFHMPLFLAVSGFLLTHETLGRLSVARLVGRYWGRMLMPWFVAWLFYCFILGWGGGGGAVRGIIYGALYPPYHLWFVPSLFLMVVALFLVQSRRINLLVVWAASGLFFIVWLSLFQTSMRGGGRWLVFLGDKRTYTLFTYFIFGYLIRNAKSGGRRRTFLVVTISTAFVFFSSYFCVMSSVVVSVSKFMLNIGLIRLVLTSRWLRRFKCRGFSELGKISLPVYLWHMVPLSLTASFFGKGTGLYYMASILSVSIMTGMLLLLSRYKKVSLLFGI